MIKVVVSRPTDKFGDIDDNVDFCIGTHNGIFHCDEVVAVAILNLLRDNVSVIRSRNIEFLNRKCDVLVDIGGGEFDHHQKGGNGERKNGVRYASAGLVWREYGNAIISKIAKENNITLSERENKLLVYLIDRDVIQVVDKEDNGEKVDNHLFSFVSSFLPDWDDESPNFDGQFQKCANVAFTLLKRQITSYILNYACYKNYQVPILSDNMVAETQIAAEIRKSKAAKDRAEMEFLRRLQIGYYHVGNVLEIPSQTMPWQELVIKNNEKHSDAPIDFVIFPYPAGGHAIQCVPPSMDEMFQQRIPLPKSWAGETERLTAISGIEGATFCHNGRFFARAETRDGVMKMAKLATLENNAELAKANLKQRK